MSEVALNPEQQQVVEHGRGPLRVAACAGSGKTTAIVERIAWLIAEEDVKPHHILAISFSTAAARQLASRVNKRIPGYEAGECVRTFHSVGLQIFKKEARSREYIDNTGMMYAAAVSRACYKVGARPEAVRDIVRAFAGLAKNHMLDIPSMRRLGGISPRLKALAEELAFDTAITPEMLVNVYVEAEEIRTNQGVEHEGKQRTFITFDDMLFQAAILLRRDEVRERWAKKWKYLIQDEAQDENTAQAHMAEALCRRHRNYTVVGDPAQSIYRFRGSAPERMLEFEETWPDQQTVLMFRNYRSGIEIVDLANRIVDEMPANTVVTDELGDAAPMVSARRSHAYVGFHVHGTDEDAEGHAIADNCVAHHRNGLQWQDQAVLVRMNAMTRGIEIALAEREVPYKLVSGVSFFTSHEAKVMFAHMRIAAHRATQTDVTTALGAMPRISRDAAESIAKSASSCATWLEGIRDCSGRSSRARANLVSYIKKLDGMRTGEFDVCLEKLAAQLAVRINPARVDSSADYFPRQFRAYASRFGSLVEMLDNIERINAHRERYSRSKDVVTVSTVHRAKGREWPIVYLPQLVDGLFPSERAQLTEERRLFYVAVTRAMDELWLSAPGVKADSGFDVTAIVSPFVMEAGFDTPMAAAKGKQVDTTPVGAQLGLGLE